MPATLLDPNLFPGPDPAAPDGYNFFPAVNSFIIAGYPMPGKWTLLEAPQVFGWQQQKGLGLDGAFVIPTGAELVTAKFKGELWTNQQAVDFRDLRKTLLVHPKRVSGAGNVVTAYGIDHPELKALGVTSVVVAKLTPLVQEEGGLWTSSLEVLQYRPPLIAPSKPTSSTPDITKVVFTAPTAVQVEKSDLIARNAALRAAK